MDRRIGFKRYKNRQNYCKGQDIVERHNRQFPEEARHIIEKRYNEISNANSRE